MICFLVIFNRITVIREFNIETIQRNIEPRRKIFRARDLLIRSLRLGLIIFNQNTKIAAPKYKPSEIKERKFLTLIIYSTISNNANPQEHEN